MKPFPKIVQITVAGVENTRNTQCNWVLHALTDDGRIFTTSNTHGWQELALPWEQEPSKFSTSLETEVQR